jgi:hypothetical protein
MAFIAGAGNPAGGGSNPSGTGQSISYVGKHAYAYSGTVAATSAETTLLEFVTGGEYIVGTIQVSSGDDSNDDLKMQLYLNGEVISAEIYTNTYYAYIDGYNPIDIIIPPYSTFKATIDVIAGTPTNVQMMLQGRVYG